MKSSVSLRKLNDNYRFAQTFSIDEVSELKSIGHGQFGDVSTARYKNQVVAIKTFRHSSPLLDLLAETSLLQFDHPGIVKILGCCYDPPCVMLSYMPLGSVKQFIESNALTYAEKLQIALDVAEALKYIHEKNYIYFDLKPSNIVVYKDKHGKKRGMLIDFGSCRHKTIDYTQTVTDLRKVPKTFFYSAPEMQTAFSSDVTYLVDIYSYGLFLLELFSTHEKFKGIVAQGATLRESFMENQFDLLVDNFFKSDKSNPQLMPFAGLIKKCLSKTLNERPSWEKVISKLKLGSRLVVSSQPGTAVVSRVFPDESAYCWIERAIKPQQIFSQMLSQHIERPICQELPIANPSSSNLYYACFYYLKWLQQQATLSIGVGYGSTPDTAFYHAVFFYRAARVEKIGQIDNFKGRLSEIIEEYSVESDYKETFVLCSVNSLMMRLQLKGLVLEDDDKPIAVFKPG